MFGTFVCCALLGQVASERPAKTPPPPAAPIGAPAAKSNSLPEIPPETEPAVEKPVIRNLFLKHYDRNGDGVLSPDELPRGLVKKFGQTDTNRDGLLDANEILHARNKLGRDARRMEGLVLDDAGNLVVRQEGTGEGAGQALAKIAAALQLLDTNNDGVVDIDEIKVVLRNPELVAAFLKQQNGGNGAGRPPAGAPAQPAAPATDSRSDELEKPAALDKPLPQEKSGLGADGLPNSAEGIIKALDKNKNGVVDRDEAVDQLAKNFALLDRDHNGSLDYAEIDRALKLARLLGVKPTTDLNRYRPKKPGETGPASSTPPAPVPNAKSNAVPPPLPKPIDSKGLGSPTTKKSGYL